MSKKLVLGLLGGMGSGKTAVGNALARHGALVISGDLLGHEALRQGPISAWAVQRWGPEILDGAGEVDRVKVAGIVFAAPDELRELEAQVFPWIRRKMQEAITAAETDEEVQLIVLDAAVLLEAGWDDLCDRLVYVDAPRELRLQRLTQKRGWTLKEVIDREDNQIPLTEKLNRADAVLDNSGTPVDLAAQVTRLLQGWGLAAVPEVHDDPCQNRSGRV